MKRFPILMLVLFVAWLAACAAPGTPAAPGNSAGTAPVLLVSGGDGSQSYTRAALEALPASQATFKDVVCRGVAVAELLRHAGFDPTQVKAVKAVAADGFTVNYAPAQVLADGVIVAYARSDGDLAPEDGAFRMVLPDAEGKLNPRMLVELQVIE